VKHLVENGGTPDCEIDLSSNYIKPDLEKSREILVELLSQHVVQILRNPLASVDGAEFFRSLNPTQLGHLIWIPKNWVVQRAWKGIISNNEAEKAIYYAHMKFFAEK